MSEIPLYEDPAVLCVIKEFSASTAALGREVVRLRDKNEAFRSALNNLAWSPAETNRGSIDLERFLRGVVALQVDRCALDDARSLLGEGGGT